MMKAVGVVILFSVHLSLWFPSVNSIEESFCFGSGYNNENQEGLGLKSMGATPLYHHPLNTMWAGNHMDRDVGMSRLDRPYLTIRRVRGTAADGSMVTLNGWLQLEISRTVGGRIVALAVWALSDKSETFGTFVNVNEPTTSCAGGNWRSYSIVPCSATPYHTPINPSMFVFTDHSWDTQNPDGRTALTLLWKADMSYCDKPEFFMFQIAMNNGNWSNYGSFVQPHANFIHKLQEARHRGLGPVLYRSIYIRNIRFYGAASPIFDKGSIVCNENTDSLPSVWPHWIEQPVNTTSDLLENMDEVFYFDRWRPRGRENLGNVKLRSVCRAAETGWVDFGGRCAIANRGSGTRIFASLDSPPRCGHDSNGFISKDYVAFEKNTSTSQYDFQQYIKDKRTEQVHQKPCDCPPIPTAAVVVKASSRSMEVQEISWVDSNPYIEPDKGCKKYSGKPEYHKQGLCVNSAAGMYALGVRQWHTIANLFCCMILVPISCFMARYLKGFIPQNHDTGQPHLPVKTWYFGHIILVLPVISLYTSGMSAIQRQLRILGSSRYAFAVFHRSGGIAVMGVFLFQCVTGFLRPLNISLRRVSIFMHWALGYFTYYFGAIICILTYRIPASPFSFQSHLSPKFNDIQHHASPILVLGWLTIDLIFHICVTVYVIKFEKSKLGINKLTHFPVFLPLRVDSYYLRTQYYTDLAQANRYLVRVFICYCVFCVMFYFMTLASMSLLNFKIHERGFGPMMCTHNSNNTFIVTVDYTEAQLNELKMYCYL